MRKAFLLIFSILSASFVTNAQTQPFKNGDRITFVGNSITEAGYYESYVWLYYMVHYPNRRIIIFNRGIGGDVARQEYERFEDDVLTADPTVICLTFGMNDSGYGEYLKANSDSFARARVEDSHHYFDLLEDKLKKLSNVRKIMITSSPYDETAKLKTVAFPGKSKTMEQIAAFQQQAAKDNHWGFVDLFHPMTEIDLKQQQTDSSFTLTGNDRIHPGNAGHFVMAWLFLKAQGLDTLPVADLSIDASGHIDRSANCTITALAATRTDVHFNYLANSLPFPVDTVPRLPGNPHRQSEAIGLVPFYGRFNREMLRVSGLEAGRYELTIDGKKIGQWTADELGQGINMAQLTNTPEYEQAMSVLQLNEERMALESKLRAYYWLQFDYLRGLGLKFNDNQLAMDSVNDAAGRRWDVASKRDNYRAARYPAVRAAWARETDLLVNDIYRVNQPKTHLVAIKKLAE